MMLRNDHVTENDTGLEALMLPLKRLAIETPAHFSATVFALITLKLTSKTPDSSTARRATQSPFLRWLIESSARSLLPQ